MRPLGVLLALCGMAGIIGAFNTDTSVSTTKYEYGISTTDRVENIGLIAKQQMIMIASCCAAIVGAMVASLGELIYALKAPQRAEEEKAKQAREAMQRRQNELQAERLAAARRETFEKGVGVISRQSKKAGGAVWGALATTPTRFDDAIARFAGTNNVLLYRFMQVMLYVVLPGTVVVIYLMLR